MKTTLSLTLTLLTFIALTLVPNSFAQDNSPEYVMRAIYFYPNDIEPHPDIDTILDYFMKDFKRHFADRMEFHGYGRKTFRFEADENGDAIVHQVKGNFNDVHYSGNTYSKVRDEFRSRFGTSKNIDFYVVDTRNQIGSLPSGEVGHTCGLGGGNSDRGYLVVPAYGECIVGKPATETGIYELIHAFGIHELLHAFGMLHDQTESNSSQLNLTSCAAEWLDKHPYFNHGQDKVVNQNTTIRMLPPTLASSPATISLRFEITDPDGLHQAQLIRSYDPIIACQKLSGTSAIIEFETTKLFGVNNIHLQVMDAHGNFTFGGQRFTIDLTNLLPSPEVVSVPDQVFRNALRSKLNLASEDTITQINILNLSHLNLFDNKNIKDLTGLEYASNLRSLFIDVEQVQDITPIAALKNLHELRVRGGQIQDITPITTLTNLIDLSIDGTQIQEITSLKTLTNLRKLGLHHTPISDITHLTQFKNLEALTLNNNPIRDIKPVWELIQLRELSLNFSWYPSTVLDISQITKFTRLEWLSLWGIQVNNTSLFAEMTNLRYLLLRGNQITDVSPLAELVNLWELHLQGNSIKNRKPLFELLEKNSKVKIYLEWGGDPLPVTLSHFQAKHTNVGVVLKWTTESEVDNAGFYIYRSETKNGEFKVVNPTMIQGAGTTGERNNYTWTDTTAKPNTVYYYRIEDVSHAGVREQLATVRLRGLISARGKLATQWVNFKKHQ